MAFTPGASMGVSNGTTDVTIVAAPAADIARTVRHISVYNADTASATITIKLDKAATERRIVVQALTTLQMWTNKSGVNGNLIGAFDLLVLDDTDEVVQLVLGGAVTTNELEWVTCYADEAI